MVRCTVHLYLPPGWELGDGAGVRADAVAALGTRIGARCAAAASSSRSSSVSSKTTPAPALRSSSISPARRTMFTLRNPSSRPI